MVDDLLLILRSRYPDFFPGDQMREIGCYSGWQEILVDLCQALERYQSSHPVSPPIKVLQVKEKFGEFDISCVRRR